MSTGAPPSGLTLPNQYYESEVDYRNPSCFSMPRGLQQRDDGMNKAGGGHDGASRFRQSQTGRSSSPFSRPLLFSPFFFNDPSRQRGNAPHHQASSPPPRGSMYSPNYLADPPKHQGQSYFRNPSQGFGLLDFAPSVSPGPHGMDRPQSSLSERSFATHDGGHPSARFNLGNGHNAKDPEFSIFVGDLSPDLREEDLVTQFLQPPSWPSHHPFALAHAQAQQMQGIYRPGARLGPAPFLSTKSAKIMMDPVTGTSRGYGFVRFTQEADCNRALVEMQGVVITPANGLSPGRPLRVSTATPKSRNSPVSASHSDGHLQMPRPHNPAHDPMASILYSGPPGRNLISPQPRPSPMSFASPISPTSPFEGSFGNQGFGAFPHHGGSSSHDQLGRTVSPPSARSHTPASTSGAAQHTPSAMDPNNTTVFVGGLSSLISEETLRQFFEPYGEITYVKIPPGKGCGFVQFVYKADADRAINLMNGFPVGNARIRLSWGRSQGDKAAAAAAQLGHLAGLAGLGTLSPEQLAQLAGLGSALSAAQANASRSGSHPAPVYTGMQPGTQGGSEGVGGAGFTNDPLSTLARQLAAAQAQGRGTPPNLHPQLQHPYQHYQQHASQLHHPQHPGHQGQHHMPPHMSHQQPLGGMDEFRSPPPPENFGAPNAVSLQALLAGANPAILQELAMRARAQEAAGGHHSDADLLQAFANLNFDQSSGGQRFDQSEGQGSNLAGRGDAYSHGFGRNPAAFMFSPFSLANSLVVGGKADQPNDDEREFDHHREEQDATL